LPTRRSSDLHLVEHLEEGARHARSAIRTGATMILVALEAARRVENLVLHGFAIGAFGKRGEDIGDGTQRLALLRVGRAELLVRPDEILVIADGITGQLVELGMGFGRN